MARRTASSAAGLTAVDPLTMRETVERDTEVEPYSKDAEEEAAAADA